MRRHLATTNHGDALTLTRVSLEADPSTDGDMEGFAALVGLLRTAVEVPDLLRHEVVCPTEIRVYHTGNNWVLESTCLKGPKE